MEITVIDDSDNVGWGAAFVRAGEIYMTSVKTMVDNVLRAVGQNSISRLNILDHGNPTSLQIGTDWVSMTSLSRYSADLRRLNGHFSQNGFVHLHHCKIGQNRPLLIALAGLFGVPVYAGTGSHHALFNFNFGDYVRCDPNGDCEGDVRRPGSRPPASAPNPWSNPNKMCCFAADTAIQTPTGILPIDAVSPGMLVYGWNPGSGQVEEARVLERQEHRGSFRIRSLSTAQGESILVTDGHRIANAAGTWVASEHLNPSDGLAGLERADSITGIEEQQRPVEAVFNLKVQGLRSYYVGERGIRVRDY